MSIDIKAKIEFSRLIISQGNDIIYSRKIKTIKTLSIDEIIIDKKERYRILINNQFIILEDYSQCMNMLTTITRLITEYKVIKKLKFKLVNKNSAITEIPLKNIVSINIANNGLKNDKEFFVIVKYGKNENNSFRSVFVSFEKAKQLSESMNKTLRIWNNYMSSFDLNSLAFVSISLDYYLDPEISNN